MAVRGQGAGASTGSAAGAGVELGMAAPAKPTGTFPPRLEIKFHRFE